MPNLAWKSEPCVPTGLELQTPPEFMWGKVQTATDYKYVSVRVVQNLNNFIMIDNCSSEKWRLKLIQKSSDVVQKWIFNVIKQEFLVKTKLDIIKIQGSFRIYETDQLRLDGSHDEDSRRLAAQESI